MNRFRGDQSEGRRLPGTEHGEWTLFWTLIQTEIGRKFQDNVSCSWTLAAPRFALDTNRSSVASCLRKATEHDKRSVVPGNR